MTTPGEWAPGEWGCFGARIRAPVRDYTSVVSSHGAVPSGPPPDLLTAGALPELTWLGQVSSGCSTTSVDRICGGLRWGRAAGAGPHLFWLR